MTGVTENRTGLSGAGHGVEVVSGNAPEALLHDEDTHRPHRSAA